MQSIQLKMQTHPTAKVDFISIAEMPSSDCTFDVYNQLS